MSALSAPVLGIRFSSTPSTTMSAQIAATTSGPTPTKVVIAVQDYLSLYSYGISAEASIVGTTEGTETVSGVNYNDPNVIYTLACVAPTPTGASGVCSSASLYTFTQAWARDTFAFEIPIPWYSNGHDRSDPQASADLTAWWMERCGYSGLDQPTTFRRCTGHWTSMNLSVTKSDIFKSTRTNVWFGITDIPVTAGLEKLAAQTEYITTTSTMCNNYFWWGRLSGSCSLPNRITSISENQGLHINRRSRFCIPESWRSSKGVLLLLDFELFGHHKLNLLLSPIAKRLSH